MLRTIGTLSLTSSSSECGQTVWNLTHFSLSADCCYMTAADVIFSFHFPQFHKCYKNPQWLKQNKKSGWSTELKQKNSIKESYFQ